VSRTNGVFRAAVVGLFVMTGGGLATADAPRRTPAQARTAPVTKPVAAKKQLKAEPAVAAPTPNAVMTRYQRIGRDIIQLQNFRGTECTLELWKTFRAIKLDDATSTTANRIATAATLQELQVRIDRKRGITIRQECLDNPLASDCQ
jgi:hypothetical protein